MNKPKLGLPAGKSPDYLGWKNRRAISRFLHWVPILGLFVSFNHFTGFYETYPRFQSRLWWVNYILQILSMATLIFFIVYERLF